MHRKITIITGKINSGKTRHIHDIFRTLKNGDGLISMKTIHGGRHTGYNLVRLATGEARMLASVQGEPPTDGTASPMLGPYRFVPDTFRYAADVIDRLIATGISPIFLDEIGLLELNGKGFHQSLKLLLASSTDLYLTVRTSYLEEMLNTYSISDHLLINLSGNSSS